MHSKVSDQIISQQTYNTTQFAHCKREDKIKLYFTLALKAETLATKLSVTNISTQLIHNFLFIK